MLRRLSLIGSVAMLACFASLWCWSHLATSAAGIGLTRAALQIGLFQGCTMLYWEPGLGDREFRWRLEDRAYGQYVDRTHFPRTWAGFAYKRDPFGYYLRIPLYLPTVAFAGLSFLLWRRARHGVGKGFDVRPTAASEGNREGG